MLPIEKTGVLGRMLGIPTISRPNGRPKVFARRRPKISMRMVDTPIAVIRKISGGAFFLRSGR